VQDKAALTSFPLLIAALRKHFQPITTAETSRMLITSMKQEVKQSVHDYTMRFRRLLAPLTDMSEADRVFQYTRGLRPDLAKEIRKDGIHTLEGAIARAMRVSGHSDFAALAGGQVGPSHAGNHNGVAPMDLTNVEGLEGDTTDHGYGSESSSSSAPSVAQLATQMTELIAAMKNMRRSPPSSSSSSSSSSAAKRLPRDREGRVKHATLSQEELDAHFAAGTCFGCGKTGHQERKCPKAAKKEQSKN